MRLQARRGKEREEVEVDDVSIETELIGYHHPTIHNDSLMRPTGKATRARVSVHDGTILVELCGEGPIPGEHGTAMSRIWLNLHHEHVDVHIIPCDQNRGNTHTFVMASQVYDKEET